MTTTAIEEVVAVAPTTTTTAGVTAADAIEAMATRTVAGAIETMVTRTVATLAHPAEVIAVPLGAEKAANVAARPQRPHLLADGTTVVGETMAEMPTALAHAAAVGLRLLAAAAAAVAVAVAVSAIDRAEAAGMAMTAAGSRAAGRQRGGLLRSEDLPLTGGRTPIGSRARPLHQSRPRSPASPR
mmetsp:Transcript_91553/g.230957  ORF Transcript_91553/g.230957 Transcript_91553/m.230957 type:complete len:185 (+) Transcript_91553:218-772(+)